MKRNDLVVLITFASNRTIYNKCIKSVVNPNLKKNRSRVVFLANHEVSLQHPFLLYNFYNYQRKYSVENLEKNVIFINHPASPSTREKKTPPKVPTTSPISILQAPAKRDPARIRTFHNIELPENLIRFVRAGQSPEHTRGEKAHTRARTRTHTCMHDAAAGAFAERANTS